MIEAHPLYLALGVDPPARQTAYRELFCDELEPGLVDAIRLATNENFVLGDLRFGEEIARTLGKRAMPSKSGRPRKPVDPVSGNLFLLKPQTVAPCCGVLITPKEPHPESHSGGCCSALGRPVARKNRH